MLDKTLRNERKTYKVVRRSRLRQNPREQRNCRPSGDTQTIIRSIAEVLVEISSREVEFHSVRPYSTDENPEVVKLLDESPALHGNSVNCSCNRQNHNQEMWNFQRGRYCRQGW